VTLITSVVLGGASASINISSIPGTYNHLRLVAFGASSTAAEATYLRIQLNGDTSGNYDENTISWSGSSNSEGTAFNIGQATWGPGEWPGASATAGTPGTIDADFPGYAQTTFRKQAKIRIGYTDGPNGDSVVALGDFLWRSTSAITAIKLYMDAGNFVAGSSFYLYGIT
jgi:hypothetical protein